MKLESTVALIIFNRPDTTREVFEAIRRARPRNLYVIADGPRAGHPDDSVKCAEARSIIEGVDWPCNVRKNYAERNLGCGVRVSSGLDWVFETCEDAIILEDDCVPSQAFFLFCSAMLERYRDDRRIMHISGSNFNVERTRNSESYLFSRYSHIWGWATWRRAWAMYDYEMTLWPKFRAERRMHDILSSAKEIRYWSRFFDGVTNKQIDTWDYQWMFAIWANRGLCVTPKKNLITNIGFTGAHTAEMSGAHAREVSDDFKITGYPAIMRDEWYDAYHFEHHFWTHFHKRIIRKLKRIWSAKQLSS